MWTTGEVKQKGKWAFKRNYRKAVVVALLFSIFVGGGTVTYNFSDSFFSGFQDGFEEGMKESSNNNDEIDYFDSTNEDDMEIGAAVAIVIVCVIFVMIVVAISIAIITVIDAFLVNPIEVGVRGFYLKNININASVRETMSAFDTPYYKNIVKVMFFRDLKTVLWFLLFIIPGIVKMYEYSMIPYLLAEHPDMPMDVAFSESRRMMHGNKWHAFVLDLSFILWHLLSALTMGILNIFYVSPYIYSTKAVLYETLRYGNGNVVYAQIGGQENQ